MEKLKDDGCWIIQLVDKTKPWLGTTLDPSSRKHIFHWVAGSEFSKSQCSTCGIVKDEHGNIISKVTPILEAAREPTAEEAGLGSEPAAVPELQALPAGEVVNGQAGDSGQTTL